MHRRLGFEDSLDLLSQLLVGRRCPETPVSCSRHVAAHERGLLFSTLGPGSCLFGSMFCARSWRMPMSCSLSELLASAPTVHPAPRRTKSQAWDVAARISPEAALQHAYFAREAAPQHHTDAAPPPRARRNNLAPQKYVRAKYSNHATATPRSECHCQNPPDSGASPVQLRPGPRKVWTCGFTLSVDRSAHVIPSRTLPDLTMTRAGTGRVVSDEAQQSPHAPWPAVCECSARAKGVRPPMLRSLTGQCIGWIQELPRYYE